jgi:hypothetical protein
MQREITMTRMGRRIGTPRYIAPHGYYIKGGVDRDDVRREMIQRLGVTNQEPPLPRPRRRK